MKVDDSNSRRKFLSTIALGAAASSFAMLTSPLNAANTKIPTLDLSTSGDADEWFKKVKGTHRVVYDGSTPHGGFPIIWTWAFYVTNNQTFTPDEDMTAVCVIRHSAIAYAFNDALWEKYNLGEMFSITDNSTGKPSKRNTVYEPQVGDFPLPGIDGLKRMQERGAMFCACDLATKVYSSVVAAQMGLDANAVYQEWVDALLPGIQLVPSGVWALGRAQEKGCGYIFAGE
jgi:intracellular sulfur oxidation DsrE/DsrF family protein